MYKAALIVLIGAFTVGIGIGWDFNRGKASPRAQVGKDTFSIIPPRKDRRSHLFPEIRKADSDEFASMLRQFADEGDQLAHHLLLARWMESDPQGAVAFVLETEGHNSEALLEMFEVWTEFDIEAALEEIARLEQPNLRSSGYRWRNAAIMTVARSAASYALERWLPKQSVQTPGWAYVAIRTLAKSDPRAAIKFLPRLQGWGEATRFTGDIARIWFANNPSEATEWVNGLDNGLASFARRVILESLHEQPDVAAEWFANLETSAQDSQVVDALHQIVGRRARSNAVAAYEWAM